MDSIVKTSSNSMAKNFSRSKLSIAGVHVVILKFAMFLVNTLSLCFLLSSALFLERSA